MTSGDAVKRAFWALSNGEGLPKVIREAYLSGYQEGDLDRQRFIRAEVKPTRKRAPRKARGG